MLIVLPTMRPTTEARVARPVDAAAVDDAVDGSGDDAEDNAGDDHAANRTLVFFNRHLAH